MLMRRAVCGWLGARQDPHTSLGEVSPRRLWSFAEGHVGCPARGRAGCTYSGSCPCCCGVRRFTSVEAAFLSGAAMAQDDLLVRRALVGAL